MLTVDKHWLKSTFSAVDHIEKDLGFKFRFENENIFLVRTL